MTIKIVRMLAALVVLVSFTGKTGIVRAASSASPAVSLQGDAAWRAPAPQPLNLPALSLPPAGSLGTQFVHVATAANIDVHQTFIDNPLTNGNPGAYLFVTQNWSPGGIAGANHNHHIGVVYSNTHNQWGIYNEDGAAMTVGDAFNVFIPAAGTNFFVQFVSTDFNSTTLNDQMTNGNPNAFILVTPNYNPGGGISGKNANFPIGVEYNTILNNWAIFDQSGGTMPTGTAFNVFVLPAAGAGVFIQTAAVANTGIYYTKINNPLTNGHPNALLFITPNFNPAGGLLDEHPTGVDYVSGYWYIVNQDLVDMPVGAAFNVLVLPSQSDVFVHQATTANSFNDQTRIDNALTNSNPNALIFATPNLNPGGGSGIYNNQNTGVTYNGSQWRIFNQNGASIPVNAAFNVLVPSPDASVFVHTSNAGNSTGDHTAIDNPLTNNNPNAILLVTQNFNPGNVGGSSDDHPLGVEYFSNKWWIYNQDGVNMPPGVAFNVSLPTAGPGVAVFVHTVTAGNTGSNLTVLDNALANLNPNAIILVTPNWDPNGLCGCVNVNFPIGVGYVGDAGLGRWAIVNQNGPSSTIPLDTAFNVYIFANYRLNLPLVIR